MSNATAGPPGCRRRFAVLDATSFSGYRFPPGIGALAARRFIRYLPNYADVAERLRPALTNAGRSFATIGAGSWAAAPRGSPAASRPGAPAPRIGPSAAWNARARSSRPHRLVRLKGRSFFENHLQKDGEQGHQREPGGAATPVVASPGDEVVAWGGSVAPGARRAGRHVRPPLFRAALLCAPGGVICPARSSSGRRPTACWRRSPPAARVRVVARLATERGANRAPSADRSRPPGSAQPAGCHGGGSPARPCVGARMRRLPFGARVLAGDTATPPSGSHATAPLRDGFWPVGRKGAAWRSAQTLATSRELSVIG